MLISLPLSAMAAGNKSTAKSKSDQSEEITKDYSLGFTADISRNMYDVDSVNQNLSSNLIFTGSYKLPTTTSISGLLWLNKSYEGERKLDPAAATVSASHSIYKHERVSIGGSVTGYIPVSESDRKNTKLKTAIRLRPSITPTLPVEGLSLTLMPSVKFNFHEYENMRSGSSNVKYSTGIRGLISYQIIDGLSISFDNSYTRSFRYSGRESDVVSLSQSISYKINENLGVGLGHSNSGDALAANGVDTEVDVFDSKTSTVSFSASLSY